MANHVITAAANQRGVSLDDGLVLAAGKSAVVSDGQYQRLAGLISQGVLVDGGTTTASLTHGTDTKTTSDEVADAEVTGGVSLAAVDALSLIRMERQSVQSLRTLSGRNAARAADALPVFTEAWTDMTQWPVTATAQVAGGRVFGTSSSWGVQRALGPAGTGLAANQRCVIRTSIHLVTGTSAVVSINNDTIGTVTGGLPNGASGGFGTTSNYSSGKGGNVTGTIVADWDGAPVNGGDYLVTVVIDENDISWTIQAEGSMAKYTQRISRSQLPNGPVCRNVTLSGSATTAAGTTFGPLSIEYEMAVPPLASRTVGGKVLFDATKHLFFVRYDPTTGIRHMIGVPGTYDPRTPSPVVLYMHGATGHAGYAFTVNAAGETKRSACTSALLAAGYIVVSSDNGTSRSGSVATDATDNRYSHQTGTDDYVAAVNYVRDHFNTGSVFLWGESMGGGHLQKILSQRVLGGVSAAASVSPGLNLVLAEQDATYQAGVRAAWGATDTPTFLTAIAGNNPVDLQGWQLRGVPQRFYVASDDTIAPPANHVEPLRSRLASYAVESSEFVGTGGHVGTALWIPSDLLAFFNKYL